MRIGVVAVAVAMVLAGCNAGGGRSQADVKACGSENYGHGTGYDGAVRECLWQAYGANQPATFATTMLTTEGDPIVSSVEIVAADRVRVTLDTTKDMFGQQKITTYTCGTMERRQINRNGMEQIRFRLTGCRGGEATELLI